MVTIVIIVLVSVFAWLGYSIGRYDGAWSERLKLSGMLLKLTIDGTPTEKYQGLLVKVKLQKAIEKEWNKE
jgi:hypothetical protein